MQETLAENPSRGYTTIRGATEYTRLSRPVLYRLMKMGKLPYIQLGRSRRLAFAALDRLMQAHTITA